MNALSFNGAVFDKVFDKYTATVTGKPYELMQQITLCKHPVLNRK